jgi:hypothetical protein
MLILFTLMQKIVLQEWANGLRYPRVGGTRQCHFDGTNSKPRKLLKNVATPTRRVRAVLGAPFELKSAERRVRIQKRQLC